MNAKTLIEYEYEDEDEDDEIDWDSIERAHAEEDRESTEIIDLNTGDQIEISLHGHKGRFVGRPGGWRPWQDPAHMFGWLAMYAVDSERWSVANKVEQQGQHQTPEVSMERKRELMVWEDEDWLILQMPAEVDFIHREGIEMQHCLGHRGTAENYAQQMQGEQDQYSLVKKEDGKPYVNFEVAITRSSYGGPVESPTITQIRGRRNQCPPADEYIVPLKKFFDANPEWTVSGHGVRSFDGGVDGDKFAARVSQLNLGESEEHEISYEECPLCQHTECVCACPDCGTKLEKHYNLTGYEKLKDSGGEYDLYCPVRSGPEPEVCAACSGGYDPTGEDCTCDEQYCSGPYGAWQDAGAPMDTERALEHWYAKLRE